MANHSSILAGRTSRTVLKAKGTTLEEESPGGKVSIVVPGKSRGSLEEGMATHSRILAGKSHGHRNLEGYSPLQSTGSYRVKQTEAT